MSYFFIMTFWFCLADGSKVYKKHVYNSVMPQHDFEPAYNISFWVKQLHLQQCVIVEIGDKYCGVFVEYRPTEPQIISEVEEYFLGLCDLATLRKWKLCPPAVENERTKECVFEENSEISNNPSRVHRRLCDITGLAVYGEPCNCSSTIFRDQKLNEVEGFPTCFLPELPQTLCVSGNVCGVSHCNASTINKIHTVKCNPHCFGQQPFCELTGPETTRASEIYSYWSDWSEPLCNSDLSNCSNDIIQSEAICINKNTGMGAVDCFGPGTDCCPANVENCRCYIYMEDGILKLSRELKLKRSYYQLKRSSLGSLMDILQRNTRMNKNIIGSKPKPLELARANAIRRKYFEKHDKLEEEEYEDDDENVEDNEEEDIILEEDKEILKVTTTEGSERNEIKQNLHSEVVHVDNKTVAVEEMAKDMNETHEDEESKASVLKTDNAHGCRGHRCQCRHKKLPCLTTCGCSGSRACLNELTECHSELSDQEDDVDLN